VVVEVTVTPLVLLAVLEAAAREQVQELMLVAQAHQDKEILAARVLILQIMVLAVVVVLVLLVQTELVLSAAQAAQELQIVLQALL
jgi:hypothetical protein